MNYVNLIDAVSNKEEVKPIPVVSPEGFRPKMNLAEYKLEIGDAWYRALKVFAKAKDEDEKYKEEWDNLLKNLKSSPTMVGKK